MKRHTYWRFQSLQANNLTRLIKETTCFQSSNPSCIDLILTNQNIMYKLSNTFETELSGHYKLISTVAKSGSFKGRPRKDLLTLKPLNKR